MRISHRFLERHLLPFIAICLFNMFFRGLEVARQEQVEPRSVATG